MKRHYALAIILAFFSVFQMDSLYGKDLKKPCSQFFQDPQTIALEEALQLQKKLEFYARFFPERFEIEILDGVFRPQIRALVDKLRRGGEVSQEEFQIYMFLKDMLNPPSVKSDQSREEFPF